MLAGLLVASLVRFLISSCRGAWAGGQLVGWLRSWVPCHFGECIEGHARVARKGTLAELPWPTMAIMAGLEMKRAGTESKQRVRTFHAPRGREPGPLVARLGQLRCVGPTRDLPMDSCARISEAEDQADLICTQPSFRRARPPSPQPIARRWPRGSKMASRRRRDSEARLRKKWRRPAGSMFERWRGDAVHDLAHHRTRGRGAGTTSFLGAQSRSGRAQAARGAIVSSPAAANPATTPCIVARRR